MPATAGRGVVKGLDFALAKRFATSRVAVEKLEFAATHKELHEIIHFVNQESTRSPTMAALVVANRVRKQPVIWWKTHSPATTTACARNAANASIRYAKRLTDDAASGYEASKGRRLAAGAELRAVPPSKHCSGNCRSCSTAIKTTQPEPGPHLPLPSRTALRNNPAHGQRTRSRRSNPNPSGDRLARLGIMQPNNLLPPAAALRRRNPSISDQRCATARAYWCRARCYTAKSSKPRKQLIAQIEDSSGALHLVLPHFYLSQLKQLAARGVANPPVRCWAKSGAVFGGSNLAKHKMPVYPNDRAWPEALTPVTRPPPGCRKHAAQADRHGAGKPAAERHPAPALLDRLNLPAFGPSVKCCTTSPDCRSKCWTSAPTRRGSGLKFDELLAQQLSMRQAAATRRERSAPIPKASSPLQAQLLASLPFPLTGARNGVVEIAADLQQPYPDAAPACGRCRQWQNHRRRAGGVAGDRIRLSGSL